MPDNSAILKAVTPLPANDSEAAGTTAGATAVIRLDDPISLWVVRRGTVDLFGVALDNGAAVGPRYPLTHVSDGGLLVGFPNTADYAVVAVKRLEAVVDQIRIEEFTVWPESQQVRLIEQWIEAIASTVFGAAPAWSECVAERGQSIALSEKQTLSAGRAIAWVRARQGTLQVASARLDEGAFLPLAAGLSVTAGSDAVVDAISTDEALNGNLRVLAEFQRQVLIAVGRLMTVAKISSTQRLQARRAADDRSLQHALRRLVDTGAAVKPQASRCQFTIRQSRRLPPLHATRVLNSRGCRGRLHRSRGPFGRWLGSTASAFGRYYCAAAGGALTAEFSWQRTASSTGPSHSYRAVRARTGL